MKDGTNDYHLFGFFLALSAINLAHNVLYKLFSFVNLIARD